MAYIKNIWVDQNVERPKTYEMVNNSDGSVTLLDSFGLVTELGTPVNADNMNHIEEGIENHEERITVIENLNFGAVIGQPIITLNNSIEDNEIWLEGAEVSKADYPNLYAIYGNTYGTPIDENNFVLPDFRNRTIWGASDFGYIEAGLPNITGHIVPLTSSRYPTDGAFKHTGRVSAGVANAGSNAYEETLFDASLSNSIYGNSDTVQPPSIKVRVKTKFE